MDHVDLGVPRQIIELLPEDGDDTAQDMQQMVAGLQGALNGAIDAADTEADAAQAAVDALEHLEDRLETYDSFVPELRAWGQSPIYAIAWRNLCADLHAQISGIDWLAPHVDRERNARIVEDGIRFGGR
jgi:hypothetical protein